jgi:hypothetical protein
MPFSLGASSCDIVRSKDSAPKQCLPTFCLHSTDKSASKCLAGTHNSKHCQASKLHRFCQHKMERTVCCQPSERKSIVRVQPRALIETCTTFDDSEATICWTLAMPRCIVPQLDEPKALVVRNKPCALHAPSLW